MMKIGLFSLLLLLIAMLIISCGQKKSAEPPKQVRRVNLDSLVRNAPTVKEVMESLPIEKQEEVRKTIDGLPGLEMR